MVASQKPKILFGRNDLIGKFHAQNSTLNGKERLDDYISYLRGGEVSRDNTKNWEEGRVPRVFNFISWADRYVLEPGTLSFSTENPNFPLWHELGIRSIFGHLTGKGDISLTAPERTIRPLQRRIIRNLGVTAKYFTPTKPNCYPRLRIGSYAGRVLSAIGFPSGNKYDNWESWPEYFTRLPEPLELGFARILYSRITKVHDLRRIAFPAVRSREIAKNIASGAKASLDSVLEHIEMCDSGRKSRKGYTPLIEMHKSQANEMRNQLMDKLILS